MCNVKVLSYFIQEEEIINEYVYNVMKEIM